MSCVVQVRIPRHSSPVQRRGSQSRSRVPERKRRKSMEEISLWRSAVAGLALIRSLTGVLELRDQSNEVRSSATAPIDLVEHMVVRRPSHYTIGIVVARIRLRSGARSGGLQFRRPISNPTIGRAVGHLKTGLLIGELGSHTETCGYSAARRRDFVARNRQCRPQASARDPTYDVRECALCIRRCNYDPVGIHGYHLLSAQRREPVRSDRASAAIRSRDSEVGGGRSDRLNSMRI